MRVLSVNLEDKPTNLKGVIENAYHHCFKIIFTESKNNFEAVMIYFCGQQLL